MVQIIKRILVIYANGRRKLQTYLKTVTPHHKKMKATLQKKTFNHNYLKKRIFTIQAKKFTVRERVNLTTIRMTKQEQRKGRTYPRVHRVPKKY